MLSYGQDRRWKARLVAEARVSATDVALDLACGTGDIALRLRAAGARTVIGLDLTPGMLELARRKGGGVHYVTGDMGALPLAAGVVDVVTTGYGLRNVPDLDVALQEIARVLRPGGAAVPRLQPAGQPGGPRLYLGTRAGGRTAGAGASRGSSTYRYIPASIRRYPGAGGGAG